MRKKIIQLIIHLLDLIKEISSEYGSQSIETHQSSGGSKQQSTDSEGDYTITWQSNGDGNWVSDTTGSPEQSQTVTKTNEWHSEPIVQEYTYYES